jgi:hypothetical protein
MATIRHELAMIRPGYDELGSDLGFEQRIPQNMQMHPVAFGVLDFGVHAFVPLYRWGTAF